MGAAVFRWLATHAAPWIAAFLIGVFWQEARCEREERAALQRAEEKRAEEAVVENVAAAGSNERVMREHARIDAILETERNRTYEASGGPIFDAADYDRLRYAYRQIYEAVPAGGAGDGQVAAGAYAGQGRASGDDEG